MLSARLRQLRAILRNHLMLTLLSLSVLLLFGLLQTFSAFPQFVESFYTRRVYAGIAAGLSRFSAVFPFSLSEVSLYLALAAFLLGGFLGLWQRRFRRTALIGFAGAAFVLLWFYLAWGINYYRPKIEEQLQFAKAAPDSVMLRENLLWCLANANEAWQPTSPWNLKELDGEIEKNYAEVSVELNLPHVSGRWPPKFLLMPGLLDYTLTSGIFGPFFHEVHLNSNLLPVEMPFVLAHEKAHGRGFARESEASFVALLVCLRSSNQAIRYSAYFALLGRSMSRYRRFSDADSLKQAIRPEIIADFMEVRNRIEKYTGPLAELSHKSYDVYLRANQVEGGVKNYSDVVELVIQWRNSRKTY
jgi:hypothetical protein